MTEKKKHIRIPNYFHQFHCIGGSCEDNCCIGWDVEIDKETYGKYQKITDKTLSQLIQNRIFINEDSYDRNVDYAMVELAKNNQCPFLNDRHLCLIQAKLGHSFLSNVCSSYPRYANRINGMDEYSANVSCPEAARLILTNKRGITFSTEDQIPYPGMIINFSVNTKTGGGNILLQYFEELRDLTIFILQNRAFPLPDRIRHLGCFYQELQDLQQGKLHGKIHVKHPEVEKLIKTAREKTMINKMDRFRDKQTKGSEKEATPKEDRTLTRQYNLISGLVAHLNKSTIIDSKRFLRFTDECVKGISTESAYTNAYEIYFRPFLESQGYILENYFVNYVFGSLFPAAESTRPFDAYQMLLLRYVLIQYYLTGIGAFRNSLTEETAVQFIQVFSKAAEHHHTYLEEARSYLYGKKSGFDLFNDAD